MKTSLKKLASLATTSALTVPAFAAGPDLSGLTSAVSVDTVITAVLAIGATLAALFVAIRGAKVVLSMIRGG